MALGLLMMVVGIGIVMASGVVVVRRLKASGATGPPDPEQMSAEIRRLLIPNLVGALLAVVGFVLVLISLFS